jgi:signal transduction histidine kinase
MIRSFSFIKLWFVLTLTFVSLNAEVYAESCGVFISSWEQPITLKDNWQFRKGDNLDWRDETVEESFWVQRSVPDYGISKTENLTGYHWYRCSFVLPENFTVPVEPLAIQLGRIRDIDEFFLNGVLIDQTGAVLPKLEVDFQKVRIYSLPSHILKPGTNVIAVRIYAATNLNGLKEAPVIYKERELRDKLFTSEVFAMICGYVFIFMGLYFLVGSIVRGRSGENFFFAFFSIFIGYYVLLRTQHRNILFESFTWSYVTELLLLICLPSLFLNFLHQYLKVKRNLILIGYEVYLGVLFIVTLFFRTPKSWILVIALFNYALPVALGLALFIFLRYGKEMIGRLRYILIGLACLLPTILIDSASALEIISFPGTIYVGFLLFLVMISIQLSNDMVLGLRNFMDQEKDLIQMERVKTGFLLNLSSEFKSGMEKIQLAIQKISSPQKPAAKKKSKTKNEVASSIDIVKQAEDHISYMGYMVEEALLLKQLEDKTYIPKWETFSISKLIRECVSSIENHLGQKRKNLSIEIKPETLEIFQAPDLIFVMVRNLVENAYIYTDIKTEVSIEFYSQNGFYHLIVTDEGLGMSQIEMETIFQKFVRGYKESKGDIPGAGIGLTLVEATAHYLGGTVSLKSAEGMGAKFIVKIPEQGKRS